MGTWGSHSWNLWESRTYLWLSGLRGRKMAFTTDSHPPLMAAGVGERCWLSETSNLPRRQKLLECVGLVNAKAIRHCLGLLHLGTGINELSLPCHTPRAQEHLSVIALIIFFFFIARAYTLAREPACLQPRSPKPTHAQSLSIQNTFC